MKEIHLICNSHLDPMWQWEWEEGAAAAVSTFRCAAHFCEAYDGLIFNHNEALLYQWIEEYEPALFVRIQKLVREGRWNIMGGWFVQPDCNLPQGESILRQIRAGRAYFWEKFGVKVDCAMNFDSFGHSRGLVQILQKTGFTSYQFMRPNFDTDLGLPQRDFWWEGYDGSRVLAHNLFAGYGAGLGGAAPKLGSMIDQDPDLPSPAALYWGVGDHGGGPSEVDIRALNKFAEELKARGILAVHSTPQRYFAALRDSGRELPVYAGHLRPSCRGCYTSQMRLKKLHRELEDRFFTVEQMACVADMNGLMPYPAADLAAAERDLLFAEFHDVLPGSSVPPVEENGLQMLYHGMEILSRLRARAFFVLSQGQHKTPDGQIPILVYNPHPYPVEKDVVCEFTLADHHWDDKTVIIPQVYAGDEQMPSQLEKEYANTNLDWRKRVVFHATLQPSAVTRFDCRLTEEPIGDGGTNDTWKTKPVHDRREFLTENGRKLCFENADGSMQAAIDMTTGRLVRYAVDGRELLGEGGLGIAAYQDNEDAWGMGDYPVDRCLGEFCAADAARAAEIAGVERPIPAVSVIENGAVRLVVEAIMIYRGSWAVVHYVLPKHGKTVEIALRLFSAQTDTLFKLQVPVGLAGERQFFGQDIFGRTPLTVGGGEQVAQAWTGAVAGDAFLGIVNSCTYGVDVDNDTIRLSLLRDPAYCSHQLLDRAFIPQDRYTARMDQGIAEYRFCLFGGAAAQIDRADRIAQVFGKAPYALSFFPSGEAAQPPKAAVCFGGETPLTMTSLQKEDGRYRLRVFNPTAAEQSVPVTSPAFGVSGVLTVPAREVAAFTVGEDGFAACSLI